MTNPCGEPRGGAVEGDVVAFLEPEPLQGAVDWNDDGEVFDTILRVYRLDSDCAAPAPCVAEDLSPELADLQPGAPAGLAVAVDASPVISGRSVALSEGRVYVRLREAENARMLTTRPIRSFSGEQIVPPGISIPGVSDDARFITFDGWPSNVVPMDTNGVHDRDADGDGILDEPEPSATSNERVSLTAGDHPTSAHAALRTRRAGAAGSHPESRLGRGSPPWRAR